MSYLSFAEIERRRPSYTQNRYFWRGSSSIRRFEVLALQRISRGTSTLGMRPWASEKLLGRPGLVTKPRNVNRLLANSLPPPAPRHATRYAASRFCLCGSSMPHSRMARRVPQLRTALLKKTPDQAGALHVIIALPSGLRLQNTREAAPALGRPRRGACSMRNARTLLVVYRSARLATGSAKPNNAAWIQPVPTSVSI